MTEIVVGDILEEWHWVKEGVDEIHSLMPWVDWTPKDVVVQCLQGEAVLHIAAEGFSVSKILTNPATGERSFFIWLAWAKGGKGQGLVAKHFTFFKDLAKLLKCSRVSTQTPIQGLGELFKEAGWRHNMSEYSISVQEKQNEI